jgi:hypothetical protein
MERQMTKFFEVQKQTFDAARPFAVVATFRSFNRVVGRYEDEAAAKRRARYLNRRESLAQLASDEASERRGLACMAGEY